MENEKKKEDDNTVTDLGIKRLRKKIMEETDPDCKDAVDDFLKKFKDDTLTGF